MRVDSESRLRMKLEQIKAKRRWDELVADYGGQDSVGLVSVSGVV